MRAASSGAAGDQRRRANLGALLRAVHVTGPVTRADLTRRLGLNRSTIGGLTAELTDLGLVAEQVGPPAGRSGRPSHLVVPRTDNVVVAVDLGVDRVEVALVGLGGEVLERRTRPHQRGEHDVAHVVETVAQMVESILAARPDVRCHGIGVAVPGAVRAQDGLVMFAPNLGWVSEPFTDLLTERVGRPVRAGNDANLGVLAEHLRGAAVGHEHAAYLSGSVGIGGGFLIDGRLLEGARGYAGEIGHLQVDPAGQTCRCGAAGCWEMTVGENRLLTLAGRLPGGGPEAVAEVAAAARAGEERAGRALDEVGDWCGIGLRAVVNLFNPEVIVLGGSLAPVFEVARERVLRSVHTSTLVPPQGDVLIRAPALGQDSALIGAAELAFQTVLEDPQGLDACGGADAEAAGV